MSLKKQDHLKWAHPLVREWFYGNFKAATEPQIQGWDSILANKATLISAPTGSGKTFAAFLVCIDRLVKKALTGKLTSSIETLYISPLKALSNDIHKNLTEPLTEIKKLAHKKGLNLPELEVAVRTGDTPHPERIKMLKKPPHILVTTPESLFILLTAEKSREMLKSVKTVIVDEIHALINNKRGSHLALSLERLDALNKKKPLRIGLSATQRPIELVAQFLTGAKKKLPQIINEGHLRKLELAIEVPESELGPVASNEMWDEIYDKIANIAKTQQSTLVFVNTRRLSERIAHHLSERLGEDKVAAHHGSLSRKLRLAAEHKLKNGELKVLVATASLELGIDIGSIDLVCQIGSPRAINVALQRIGRAGHHVGGISKGVFFASTRDELLECAALAYAIKEGKLDEIIYPREPLDILAQQIIACCAAEDWEEDKLFAMLKNAFPYQHLSKKVFEDLLTMLADGIAGSRARYGAYLFRDKLNGLLKGRRGSRLAAITSGGAIPDTGLFRMLAEPEQVMVGTLDEDFAVESNRGDIILLGTTSWQVKRVESAASRVIVENAHGAPPSVPFWRGEAPGRSNELSQYVSILREKLNELLPLEKPIIVEVNKHPMAKEAKQWLMQNCHMDDCGAEQLIEYLLQGRAILGAIPSQKTIVAERFFDEAGGMQLIIHAPFGMRINKAWGLALRKCFCRSFNFELQAAATDNGLNISLAEQHSFPLQDVFQFIHPNSLEKNLVQAILQSPFFKTRWRWTATRSLALLRFKGGRKVAPNIQRMLSDDLLAAVFPDAAACQDNLGGKDIELPEHPIIDETMKDILEDALDFQGLLKLIENIQNGKIQTLAIDTPMPSVFSHEILNANPYAYLDDAPLEERRARAVEMRRTLPETLLNEIGKLDPEAIKEVQTQAWPDIRTADEMQDLLHSLIILPDKINITEQQQADSTWEVFLNELIAKGLAQQLQYKNQIMWFATEKAASVKCLFPEVEITLNSESFNKLMGNKFSVNKDEELLNILRNWMQILGPTSSAELNKILTIDNFEIEQALLRLENSGQILRGRFRSELNIEQEWCERRLLARIHRYTIGKLRKEISPVSAAEFMNWLFTWQHVSSGTQLIGEEGLFEIIRQLQGFEIAANAWESQIFTKRLKFYEKDSLDRLCLTGRIGWGRLSGYAVLENNTENIQVNKKDKQILSGIKEKKKNARPTSIAPITFFVREDGSWINPKNTFEEVESLENLTHVARSVYLFLKERGASFISDIVRGTKRLEAEVENALWELVVLGAITADSFDNLRSIIDPKRRLHKKDRRGRVRTRFSTGRWSILHLPSYNLDEEQHEHHENYAKYEALCWMLLKRYGVVFRDLLARERNLPRWRDLLVAFRRLEDRGEIRGGRFVSGFQGEQFALPYAVESLRAARKENSVKPKDSASNIVSISSVDPLNLIGIILPGSRVSSGGRSKIIFENGLPKLLDPT